MKEIEMLARSLLKLVEAKLPDGTRPRVVHIHFDGNPSWLNVDIDVNPGSDFWDDVSDCKSGAGEEGGRNE